MDIGSSHNKDRTADLAVWCLTPGGKLLGQKIQRAFSGRCRLFLSDRLGPVSDGDPQTSGFQSLSAEIARQFHRFDSHLFIFSTGIVVRMIAPLIQSKLTDPGVVVMDEKARFAISLLSGHIGGANELAGTLSKLFGAVPVVTTATDVNDLPAIDLIAAQQNLMIETPENIKHINMAFLKKEPVAVIDPENRVLPYLPRGLLADAHARVSGRHTVFCSYKTDPVSRETLVLRPRVLCVGIGCNRGTPVQSLKRFLEAQFAAAGLSISSIDRLATIDLKSDEKGLLDLSEQMKIPLMLYAKEALNAVKTIQTPSDTVHRHVGVKSVCEAAALLAAGHENLMITKKKNKDVTIAVAKIQ